MKPAIRRARKVRTKVRWKNENHVRKKCHVFDRPRMEDTLGRDWPPHHWLAPMPIRQIPFWDKQRKNGFGDWPRQKMIMFNYLEWYKFYYLLSRTFLNLLVSYLFLFRFLGCAVGKQKLFKNMLQKLFGIFKKNAKFVTNLLFLSKFVILSKFAISVQICHFCPNLSFCQNLLFLSKFVNFCQNLSLYCQIFAKKN